MPYSFRILPQASSQFKVQLEEISSNSNKKTIAGNPLLEKEKLPDHSFVVRSKASVRGFFEQQQMHLPEKGFQKTAYTIDSLPLLLLSLGKLFEKKLNTYKGLPFFSELLEPSVRELTLKEGMLTLLPQLKKSPIRNLFLEVLIAGAQSKDQESISEEFYREPLTEIATYELKKSTFRLAIYSCLKKVSEFQSDDAQHAFFDFIKPYINKNILLDCIFKRLFQPIHLSSQNDLNKKYQITTFYLRALEHYFKKNLDCRIFEKKIFRVLKVVPLDEGIEYLFPHLVESSLFERVLKTLMIQSDRKAIERDAISFFNKLLEQINTLKLEGNYKFSLLTKIARLGSSKVLEQENFQYFNLFKKQQSFFLKFFSNFIPPGQETAFLLKAMPCNEKPEWENRKILNRFDRFTKKKDATYHSIHTFYLPFWKAYIQKNFSQNGLEVLTSLFSKDLSGTFAGLSLIYALKNKFEDEDYHEVFRFLSGKWLEDKELALAFFGSVAINRRGIRSYFNSLKKNILEDPLNHPFLEFLILHVDQPSNENNISIKKEIIETIGLSALEHLNAYKGYLDWTALFSNIYKTEGIGLKKLWKTVKNLEEEIILACLHDLAYSCREEATNILNRIWPEASQCLTFENSLAWMLKNKGSTLLSPKVLLKIFFLPDADEEKLNEFWDKFSQSFAKKHYRKLQKDDLDCIDFLITKFSVHPFTFRSHLHLEKEVKYALIEAFGISEFCKAPTKVKRYLQNYEFQHLSKQIKTDKILEIFPPFFKKWKEEDCKPFIFLLIHCWIATSNKEEKEAVFSGFEAVQKAKNWKPDKLFEIFDQFNPLKKEQPFLLQFFKEVFKKNTKEAAVYYRSHGSGDFLQIFFTDKKGKIESFLFTKKLEEIKQFNKEKDDGLLLARWFSGFSFPQFKYVFEAYPEKALFLFEIWKQDILNEHPSFKLSQLKLGWGNLFQKGLFTLKIYETTYSFFGRGFYTALFNLFVEAAAVYRGQFPKILIDSLKNPFKTHDDDTLENKDYKATLRYFESDNPLKAFKEELHTKEALAAFPMFYPEIDHNTFIRVLQRAPKVFLKVPYQGGLHEKKVVEAIEAYSETLTERGATLLNLKYDPENPYQVRLRNKLLKKLIDDLDTCIQLQGETLLDHHLFETSSDEIFKNESLKKRYEKVKNEKNAICKPLFDLQENVFKRKVTPLKKSLNPKIIQKGKRQAAQFIEKEGLANLKKFLHDLFVNFETKVPSTYLNNAKETASILFRFVDIKNTSEAFATLNDLLIPCSKYPELLFSILKGELFGMMFAPFPDKLKSLATHFYYTCCFEHNILFDKAKTKFKKIIKKETSDILGFNYIKSLFNLSPEKIFKDLSNLNPDQLIERVEKYLGSYLQDEIPSFFFMGLLEKKLLSQIFYNHPSDLQELMKYLEYPEDEEGFEQIHLDFQIIFSHIDEVNPQLFFFISKQIEDYPVDDFKKALTHYLN